MYLAVHGELKFLDGDSCLTVNTIIKHDTRQYSVTESIIHWNDKSFSAVGVYILVKTER